MNINDNSDISRPFMTIYRHTSFQASCPKASNMQPAPWIAYDCIRAPFGDVWCVLICANRCEQRLCVFGGPGQGKKTAKSMLHPGLQLLATTVPQLQSTMQSFMHLHTNASHDFTILYYTLLILTQSQPMCCAMMCFELL